MRLAILGSSHVAALKQGWEMLRPGCPDVVPTFFASRGTRLSAMRVSGSRLVPGTDEVARDIAFTSGGLAAFDPAAFDAVLIHGLAGPLRPLDVRLSRAVRATAGAAMARRSIGLALAQKIRRIGDIPIFVGLAPQPAAASATPGPKPVAYADLFPLVAAGVDLPGTVLLSQPASTIVDDWYTAPEFSVGSRRLDVGDLTSGQAHPDDDTVHMNGRFGALYLRQLFEDHLRVAEPA